MEDEEALSRLISWSLLDAGHEVGVVATPAAAVERLSTYRPDVIVFNTVIAHDAKDAWIARIRETATEARILDVSDEKNARASGIIGASRDGASADGSLAQRNRSVAGCQAWTGVSHCAARWVAPTSEARHLRASGVRGAKTTKG